MRERLLVIAFLLGVPILVGIAVEATRSSGSSASTASWVHLATTRAGRSGLKHVQCQRDGVRIDCTATNGSASYTIVGHRLDRSSIVVRAP